MSIEELYTDEEFHDMLLGYARKCGLYSFDDYRQDVFLEIVEHGYTQRRDFKRAADRVARRLESRDGGAIDIGFYSYIDDDGNAETEEETMSRLVYQGRAVKVG